MQSQCKRSVWKITEMRDGCIWKTKDMGRVWVRIDIDLTKAQENEIAKQHGGDFLGSLSTSEMKDYDNCFRTVRETSPDFIV